MSNITRRTFLHRSAAAAGAAVAAGYAAGQQTAQAGQPSAHAAPTLNAPHPSQSTQGSQVPPAGKPIIIASANGKVAIAKAMEMIKGGSDALDAVIAGANIVENDPEDMSVGYGGLPNEEGVVELDAAVMHGPSYRAGSVASIRNIKNPSSVARMVMERSDHVLLVGDGALKFAKAHGFPEENLLTDKARQAWLKWKENVSPNDDWLPPHGIDDQEIGGIDPEYRRHYGTIHISALDGKGGLSCVTTTSGLEYKIPGRVGDSPIIGAGLYLDNEVGSAGSTGRGEANLLNLSSAMIVEWMRDGKTPQEACLLACQRIQSRQRERRLQDGEGRFRHNVKFYAINRAGVHGGAAIWKGGEYIIHDGTEVKSVELAYLYQK